MSSTKRISPPDVPQPTKAAFQILLTLVNEEKHGYAIMQEIVHRTEGAVRLGPGTLYRTIRQMLDADWIEECGERPDPQMDDERRRYYRISALGHRVAAAEAQQMESLVRIAYANHLLTAKGWAR